MHGLVRKYYHDWGAKNKFTRWEAGQKGRKQDRDSHSRRILLCQSKVDLPQPEA
jgi:hypothetical protein